MKEHPVRGLQVIGEEVYWEGELVLFINPNLGASVDQHIRDTLEGITVDDYANKGPQQKLKEISDAREDLEERDAELETALADLKAANVQMAEALRERDEARAFGGKLLKDHTAWIAWARSMGYIQ